MPKLDLFNMEGSKVGNIELSDAIFAHEINKVALHQVVVNYLANQRQGTQSTKTRSEVQAVQDRVQSEHPSGLKAVSLSVPNPEITVTL